MKVLAIEGGTAGDRAALVRRLADRLGEDGPVGVVTAGADGTDDAETDGGTGRAAGRRRDPDPAARPPGVAVRYDLGADGWTVAGDGGSLADALDRLAPSCDYALVVDVPDADLPRIVVGQPAEGDDAADGPVLATGTDPGSVDLDAVVAGLEATEDHETLASLVARAKRSPDAPKAGAVATFTGRVRAIEDDDDRPTERLEFEKYEGVADERTAALRADLLARDGVHEVLLHHRTGAVEYGEDIVFVVVLAGHREEAFRTVQDGINRLKEEVPIFKKEVTVDGEFWVHDPPEGA